MTHLADGTVVRCMGSYKLISYVGLKSGGSHQEGALSQKTAMLTAGIAWRMALAWQESLQERVRLVAPRPTISIVPSYEWITFRLEPAEPIESQLEKVHAFRAACIAWFALSCCHGFSGRENPGFWKRVFGVLRVPRLRPSESVQPAHTGDDLYTRPVSDAARFFDVDGHDTFPRVRLFENSFGPRSRSERYEDFILVFVNGVATKTSQTENIDRTLEAILRELAPFVMPCRSQRSIPVSLKCRGTTTAATIGELLALLSKNILSVASFTELNPAFSVQELAIKIPGSAAKLEHFHALYLPHPISIKKATLIYPHLHATHTSRSRYLETILPTEASAQVRVKRHKFCVWGENNPYDGELCSVLPVVSSFEELELLTLGSDSIEPPDLMWAWMGYALFHPNASTSSWSRLRLKNLHMSQRSIDALRAMAMGNNLLAVMSGKPPRLKAYYSAQLHAGAHVYSEPRLNSDILTTLSSQSTVDACLSSADGITSLPEWTAVIIPFHGLGWTLSSRLSCLTETPASVSTLKTLYFQSGTTATAELTQFVYLLGPRLEFLDIGDFSLLDSSDLSVLLGYCPILKSLRVAHNGSLWTGPSVEGYAHQQLDELALCMVSTTLPLLPLESESLKSLQALRVEGDSAASCVRFSDSLRFTFESLPRLRYIHFTCPQTDINEPLTYMENREFSLSTMGIGIEDERRARLKHELAFLSILSSKSSPSALSSLGSDVLRVIFDFAATPSRAIWIENNGREAEWKYKPWACVIFSHLD